MKKKGAKSDFLTPFQIQEKRHDNEEMLSRTWRGLGESKKILKFLNREGEKESD